MQNEENASEWPPESLDWVLENLSRLNDTDDSQNANDEQHFHYMCLFQGLNAMVTK